jgi:hypothetical protein
MLIRQAITTKFLPDTNSKPSRVKATAEAGSVTLSWGNAGIEDNHAAAAQALAAKFGWHGHYYQAALPGGGYCFVCVDQRDTAPVFTIEVQP